MVPVDVPMIFEEVLEFHKIILWIFGKFQGSLRKFESF